MENFIQWTVDGLNVFNTPWAELFHFAASLLIVAWLAAVAWIVLVGVIAIINGIGESRAQKRRARYLQGRQAWLAMKAQADPNALNRAPDGLLERSAGYRFGQWVRNRRRAAALRKNAA
jgi:hypothetical protein